MSDTTVPARELTLDIESPAAGGTSIARHDGQVVFVSGGLPGERVRVVTEAGPPAKFLRAQVTEVLEASVLRVPDRRLAFAAPGASAETDGTDWRTRVQLAVDSEGRAGMLAARSHDVIPVTRPPLAAGALADLELGRLRLPGLRRLEFAWAGDHGALIVRGTPSPQVL